MNELLKVFSFESCSVFVQFELYAAEYNTVLAETFFIPSLEFFEACPLPFQPIIES